MSRPLTRVWVKTPSIVYPTSAFPLRERPDHVFRRQIEGPYGIAFAVLDLDDDPLAQHVLMALWIESHAVPGHDQLVRFDVGFEKGLLDFIRFRGFRPVDGVGQDDHSGE